MIFLFFVIILIIIVCTRDRAQISQREGTTIEPKLRPIIKPLRAAKKAQKKVTFNRLVEQLSIDNDNNKNYNIVPINDASKQ